MPGMEHANLGLRPLPDLNQGGRLVDEFAVPENRDQQIFESGFWRKMFAARRIQRINDGERFGHATFSTSKIPSPMNSLSERKRRTCWMPGLETLAACSLNLIL